MLCACLDCAGFLFQILNNIGSHSPVLFPERYFFKLRVFSDKFQEQRFCSRTHIKGYRKLCPVLCGRYLKDSLWSAVQLIGYLKFSAAFGARRYRKFYSALKVKIFVADNCIIAYLADKSVLILMSTVREAVGVNFL